MAAARPRILVIDGNPEVRLVLAEAMADAGYEVRTEPDGQALSQVAEDYRPDLVVLRVQLPAGPDGCELTEQLRSSSDLPILLIDSTDSDAVRVSGLEAGADDVLSLPLSVKEIVGYVQILLQRSGRLSSLVREVGDLVVDEDSRTATRAGQQLVLTRTEFDLLKLFVRNPGRLIHKRQVFAEVSRWGDFNPHLVEVQVSALRRKLEEHGPRIIETVRGEGYRLISR